MNKKSASHTPDSPSAPGEQDIQLLADTALLAGSIMLLAGAETYRVEDTIHRILQTSGFEHCDAFVIPTGITITLEDWRYDTISLTRRIGEKQTNLGNIAKVNEISRQYCCRSLTLKEAFHALKHMEPTVYPDWLIHLSMIVTAACFALTLGAGLWEGVIAGFNGLYFILSRMINRRLHLNSFVFNMFASFFMAFTSMLVKNTLYPDLLLEPLIAGSIMALLPGVAMTNGIRDTLAGDYVSGSARMIEAFVTAASLALGIGVGLSGCQLFFRLGDFSAAAVVLLSPEISLLPALPPAVAGFLLQSIGSFLAVVTLSLIFYVPRRFLCYAGIAGALGWLTYLGLQALSSNEMLDMFAASLLVALFSHVFARIFKTPVTMFLIPGILPLVPGVGMYRIVYFMLLENSAMAGYYFFYTLQMAGMIAIAIFIMDTIVKMITSGRRHSGAGCEKS